MLDTKDKELLNLLQTDFPLETRPFAVLGRRLEMPEKDVIARIMHLKERRIIRQISAIFDSRALGYRSSLVAFKVDPEQIARVAERVSEHTGVTHNYRRNHEYNLWFTITVPPGKDLENEVEGLSEQEGVLGCRLFPTIRLFKIGVAFDMLAEESAGADVAAPVHEPGTQLLEDDIPAVRQLQRDLPIEPRPFMLLAREIGMTDEYLVAKAREFLQRGLMRRYAAVLRHREAGFTANAMGAWKVPEEFVPEFGRKAAEFPAVSHCYQRPTYPDWPYSVFTMIHGRSEDECAATALRIAEAVGIGEYILLYSTEEYKKIRMDYFED